jgi:hypothetical protein
MSVIHLGLYYWAPVDGDWARGRFVCRLWLVNGNNAPWPTIR